MSDGSVRTGITDNEGRTARFFSAGALAVSKIVLAADDLPTCCTLHAAMSDDRSVALEVAPQGVSTTSVDLGTSVREVRTPPDESRGLTSGEIAMSRLVFGNSIDYARVKVHNGEFLWFGMQDDDTAMTPNGEMYFNAKHFKEDFSQEDAFGQHWFMHEMTHVWQYQLGYPVMLRGAIRLGLPYEYELAPGRRLSAYNMEAQGNVLADYFVLRHLNAARAMRERRYAGSLAVFESETLVDFLQNPGSKSNLPGSD